MDVCGCECGCEGGLRELRAAADPPAATRTHVLHTHAVLTHPPPRAPPHPPHHQMDMSLFPQYPLTPPITGLLADGSISGQSFGGSARFRPTVLHASIDSPLLP